MIDWIIVGTYLTVFVYTARMFGGETFYDFVGDSEAAPEDYLFSIFMGCIKGILWPVVLPFYILNNSGRSSIITNIIFKTPKHEKIRILEKNKREQEWKIKQLERELGVR